MGRIAWFDCPAGISGDMALAALLHAGADLDHVRDAVDSVCGFLTGLSVATAGEVPVGLKLSLDLPPEHAHRTLRDITAMIESAAGGLLCERAAVDAIRVFGALATAEATVHGCAPDDVTFHEVGAADSIVDIVGIAAALADLDVDRVAASPLPLTRGTVMTMHGLLPVPAPATMELLRGWDVYGVDAAGEFVTPTGAAICHALAGSAGPAPAMTVTASGYGYGTKSWPDGRPNCVRVVIGESALRQPADPGVREISANIDDSTPEQVSWLIDRLMAAGSLDAWITPIQMKKGRPAWKVSALCTDEKVTTVTEVFFAESTTIGVRIATMDRITLDRVVETVQSEFGPITVKTARLDGVVRNIAAEPDELRRIAVATGIPLKEVRGRIDAFLGRR